MVHDHEALLHKAQASMAAVREYSGTDLFNHLRELLGSLADLHTAELVNIEPEALRYKQGAIRQVIAIRDALTANETTIPTV